MLPCHDLQFTWKRTGTNERWTICRPVTCSWHAQDLYERDVANLQPPHDDDDDGDGGHGDPGVGVGNTKLQGTSIG